MNSQDSPTRLSRQIAFLIEADKLKRVERRTPLADGSRRENSAEHSWHLIVAAMIMRERYRGDVDLLRVLEMLALHDLVEIDAGDTFAYDANHLTTKSEREAAAADRIFSLLPSDQAARCRALWEEFEEHASPEACFANALDRLQPLLQNACSKGGSWRDYDLNRAQVLRRMAPIESTLPEVWTYVLTVVDDFCASGLLKDTR